MICQRMVDEKNDTGKNRCAGCGDDIDFGGDAMAVEEGVLGPRGFVPLEKKLFCSEQCISEYFCNDDLEEVPRRIP